MIRLLDDMPPGVLGLEAIDDVERSDYTEVLAPAIEAALAEHGKVRLVYVLGPAFDEYAFPLADLESAKRWAAEDAG